MIRTAIPSDWPGVYALLERLRGMIETYPGAALDRESAFKVFGQCLGSSLGYAAVAVHDGQITGLMLGVVQELWFSRAREATDLVLYAEHPGDGLAMVRKFIDWAHTVPRVTCVTLAQSSALEVDRSDLVLAHLGMRRIGLVRQLAINRGKAQAKEIAA